MTASTVARPPRVDIPEAIWNHAQQLGSFIARLAVEHGPILTIVPRVGPLAGRDVVYLVGPEANRLVLLTQRACFSHDQGWTPVIGETLGHGLGAEPASGARVDAELAALGDRDAPLTSEALRSLPVLAAAIREAGRLYPPVLLLPRGVLAAFDFGGFTIAPGTPVFLVVAAGHRLATVFADPDHFDLDRFLPPRDEDRRHPYALVTFGGGPRICLGINFAQVEVTALAAHVRRHYRLVPIPGRAIPQVGGIIQSLPEGIPVRVQPLIS